MDTVPSKVVVKNQSVYLIKHCRTHGQQIELLEEDADYFFAKRRYDKPGTAAITQKEVEKGCPFDCGLCPQHDQHTCIGLIEVTSQCDMKCPVCYASADQGAFLDMKTIENMMVLRKTPIIILEG
jgi:hypothetical protein